MMDQHLSIGHREIEYPDMKSFIVNWYLKLSTLLSFIILKPSQIIRNSISSPDSPYSGTRSLIDYETDTIDSDGHFKLYPARDEPELLPQSEDYGSMEFKIIMLISAILLFGLYIVSRKLKPKNPNSPIINPIRRHAHFNDQLGQIEAGYHLSSENSALGEQNTNPTYRTFISLSQGALSSIPDIIRHPIDHYVNRSESSDTDERSSTDSSENSLLTASVTDLSEKNTVCVGFTSTNGSFPNLRVTSNGKLQVVEDTLSFNPMSAWVDFTSDDLKLESSILPDAIESAASSESFSVINSSIQEMWRMELDDTEILSEGASLNDRCRDFSEDLVQTTLEWKNDIITTSSYRSSFMLANADFFTRFEGSVDNNYVSYRCGLNSHLQSEISNNNYIFKPVDILNLNLNIVDGTLKHSTRGKQSRCKCAENEYYSSLNDLYINENTIN